LNTAPLPAPRKAPSERQAIVIGTMRGFAGGREHGRVDGDPREREYEDGIRAEAVGEPASDRARERGHDREARSAQARVHERELEPVPEQLGQEQRHRDEAAEGDEVEDGEAVQAPPGAQDSEVVGPRHPRRVLGRAPEEDSAGGEHGAREQAERRPAPLAHHHGRSERRDRGADVASAVDADGESLALPREPAGHEGDADRERGSGDSEQEADGEQRPVTRGEAEQDGWHGGDEQEEREHAPPAEVVGEEPDRDAEERAEDDGDGGEEVGLGAREVEVVLELRRQRRDQAPGAEAQGEASVARARLRTGRDIASSAAFRAVTPRATQCSAAARGD
jgi:hypothetical protein